jgi:hypothetical protein
MSFKIGLKRIVNVFFWFYVLVGGYIVFNILIDNGSSLIISIFGVLINILIGLIIKLILNYIIDGFFY